VNKTEASLTTVSNNNLCLSKISKILYKVQNLRNASTVMLWVPISKTIVTSFSVQSFIVLVVLASTSNQSKVSECSISASRLHLFDVANSTLHKKICRRCFFKDTSWETYLFHRRRAKRPRYTTRRGTDSPSATPRCHEGRTHPLTNYSRHLHMSTWLKQSRKSRAPLHSSASAEILWMTKAEEGVAPSKTISF